MTNARDYPGSIATLLTEYTENAAAAGQVRNGDEWVKKQDYPQARQCYSGALNIQPDNYDAMAGIDYLDYLISPPKERYCWTPKPLPNEINEQRAFNRELNRREFEAKKTVLKSVPTMCLLELTTRCNFSCIHCHRRYFPVPETDIDVNLLDSLFANVFPKLDWITVTGFGEQTISRHYPSVMARLVALQIVSHYSTNTSTLTPAHIEALVKCNANIILSVDGTSKETFESIRCGGKWHQLLKSLFLIKRIRAILGGDSLFRITFVIMRKNIHELPDMVRLINFFNLDDLTVQDYLPVGDPVMDQQTLRHEPERANRYLNDAAKLAKEYNMKILLPDPFPTDAPSPGDGLWKRFRRIRRVFPERKRFPMRCFQPWSSPCFRANGDVSPCCNSSRSMGSLHEKCFEEIWNGWRFRLFRRMADSFLPPPECRICNVIDSINSGNPANTIQKEGLIVKSLYYIERKLRRAFLKIHGN
ncbi:SPASM domain-containing protein [bacterium]|nr:SPASM domain-containing protein [candidate division CSSED10-310 bacterium]